MNFNQMYNETFSEIENIFNTIEKRSKENKENLAGMGINLSKNKIEYTSDRLNYFVRNYNNLISELCLMNQGLENMYAKGLSPQNLETYLAQGSDKIKKMTLELLKVKTPDFDQLFYAQGVQESMEKLLKFAKEPKRKINDYLNKIQECKKDIEESHKELMNPKNKILSIVKTGKKLDDTFITDRINPYIEKLNVILEKYFKNAENTISSNMFAPVLE